MGFLRTLFWVLLAGIAVAFAFNNWTTVPIRLWGGLIADVNLPLMLLLTFLAGLLPMLLIHLTTRWRLRQRLTALEQTMAEFHRAHAVAPIAPTAPVVADAAVPADKLSGTPTLLHVTPTSVSPGGE